MAKRYAVLGPKIPMKKKTTPFAGYAALPGTFKHKLSLPSSKTHVSSAAGVGGATLTSKDDAVAKKSPKASNDGPKKDRYLALGDPTETSDSSSKGGPAHQAAKDGKDSQAVKGAPRRRRIKFIPFTLSVGAGVLSFIAIICVLVVVLTGEEMKLINLDQYCRSKYGLCAYYRNKLIDECMSTKDYCSSVEINPDLFLQKKKVDRFIEPDVKSEYKAELTFPVWRRGRGPLIIPNGAPCDLKTKNGTIGWCVDGHCTPMNLHEPTTTFTSQTTTNGQWSSFAPLDQLNFSCFNIAKEPKIKYEQLIRSITNNLECEKLGICRNHSLVIRTCTEPRPSFGGQYCHSPINLQNGSEYLADSPLRWRACKSCGAGVVEDQISDCAATNDTIPKDVCHFSLKTNEYSVNLAKIESSIQWTIGEKNDLSPCCDAASRLGFCLAGICVPIDKKDD